MKFALELAAFAAFGYWGATVGEGAISVLVAVAAPLAAIVAWAMFAAPKSSRRLSRSARVPFELTVFALAAAALAAAGRPLLALVFTGAALANAAVLEALSDGRERPLGTRAGHPAGGEGDEKPKVQ